MDVAVGKVLPMLPVLLAFAETGQTTAAADLLQMPQSTVSRVLARLGDELGTPVVERRGRSLHLTPAGKALLPHAAAAVAAATDGVEAVGAGQADARGTITLAFQSTLGERVVPALMRAFLQEHPGTAFGLLQVSRPQCLAALEDGDAEFAFVSPTAEGPGLISLRLHDEPLVLVVPTGHRLASATRLTFQDAAAETFVCMKRGYGMRTYLDDLARSAGFTPEVGFEGDDLATLRGLVSAGLGVALAPRDPRGTSGCIEVPILQPAASRRIGVCWPDEPPTVLAGAFQTLLRRRGARLTEIGLRTPDI